MKPDLSDLVEFISYLTKLKILCMRINARKYSEKVMRWLSSCKKLHTLRLSACHFNVEGLICILSNLPSSMRVLNVISMRPGLVNLVCRDLACASTLEELSIILGGFHEDNPASKTIEGIIRLKNLRILELRGASFSLSDTYMMSICRELTRLEYLWLQFCYDDGGRLTDFVWTSLLNLKNLKRLTLHGPMRLTEAGYSAYCWELSPSNNGICITMNNFFSYLWNDDEPDLDNFNRRLKETAIGVFPIE